MFSKRRNDIISMEVSLNSQRVSPLDIDLDTEGPRKEDIIKKITDDYGGYRHVTKVLTLLTAKSKAALQIACRGLSLSPDVGIFLGSFIKAERGIPFTLSQTYENDKQFRELMDGQYNEVWKIAKNIEGMIIGYGAHAGGCIVSKEDIVDSVSIMKIKSGDIVVGNDLHTAESASLIKWDLLSTDAQTKMHIALDLLLQDGLIQWQGSLKSTYNKYLNPYTIDRVSDVLWDNIDEHKILSLFQFETPVGGNAIDLCKPRNLEDLVALNSIMRLMGDEEQPIERLKRFKDNIQEWYDEMRAWGLTEDEMEWLNGYCYYGFLHAQETFMKIVQDERIGGHSLLFADILRKGVAKKVGKIFTDCEETYYNTMKEKGLSENLCRYVWEVLINMSRGYSFNLAHVLFYTVIGLQEANIYTHYPSVYWNCAVLISDSGSNGVTKYDKIANAVNKLKKNGITVKPPFINEAKLDFAPHGDEIVYGLRPLVGLPSAMAEKIVEEKTTNGNFKSMSDFMERVKPTNSAMLALIKAGCFDEFGDRLDIMIDYVKSTIKPKAKLTTKDLDFAVKNGLVDGKNEKIRVARFKDYICKPEFFIENPGKSAATGWYLIPFDDRFNSAKFFETYYMADMTEEKDYKYHKRGYLVKRGSIDKVAKKVAEDILIDKAIISKFNEFKWKEKMPEGTVPSWEIETLLTYFGKHELADIDKNEYSISNFFELPEEPVIAKENYKLWKGKVMHRQEIFRLAGTVIATDKNKNLITLLTEDGAVTCKLYGGQFRNYMNSADGQENWLVKGTLLFVHGYRAGDQFICKSYTDSAFGRHVLNRLKLTEDGNVIREVEKTIER